MARARRKSSKLAAGPGLTRQRAAVRLRLSSPAGSQRAYSAQQVTRQNREFLRIQGWILIQMHVGKFVPSATRNASQLSIIGKRDSMAPVRA